MYNFWQIGGWPPVSMSIVMRLVLPISLLFFEKTSGKCSQSSSNFSAVSSPVGLLFNFTFLCLLTSAGLHIKSDLGGIGSRYPVSVSLLAHYFFYFEDFIFFIAFFLCKSNYSSFQNIAVVYIAKVKDTIRNICLSCFSFSCFIWYFTCSFF